MGSRELLEWLQCLKGRKRRPEMLRVIGLGRAPITGESPGRTTY
jgi:hypothetical protein